MNNCASHSRYFSDELDAQIFYSKKEHMFTSVTELTDYETLMGSEESNSFYEQYHLNMTDVSDLSALGN